MPIVLVILMAYLLVGALSALYIVGIEIKHRKTSRNTVGEIALLALLFLLMWPSWLFQLAVSELMNDFNHDSK